MNVLDWLRESDPSIRWQVMQDLDGAPEAVVAAQRSRVAAEGWAPRLLASQKADGGWGVENPTRWIETPDGSAIEVLILLKEMGLDPTCSQARAAVVKIRDEVTHYEGGNTSLGR